MANAPFGCPSISGAGAGDFSLTYAVRSPTCLSDPTIPKRVVPDKDSDRLVGMEDTLAATSTHVFRVSLKSRLYRDIEITSDDSLADLAEVIVKAFDFSFDHAYGFFSAMSGNVYKSPVRYELFADADGGRKAGSVKRTKVGDAFARVGSRMLFLFDYGDEWRFKVEVVAIGEAAPKVRYPRVLATVGKAPDQYPDPDEDD